MPVDISGAGTITGLQSEGISSQPVFPGNVIQVVQAISNTDTSTTSNSLIDVEPSVTITPFSANSKILVTHTAGGMVRNDPQDIKFSLEKDGVTIWQASRYGFIEAGNTGEWYAIPFHASYLDSPSTTSAIVYNFAIQTAFSADIRHNDNSTFPGTTEAITIAMEIAG